jgi:hypothetical protein
MGEIHYHDFGNPHPEEPNESAFVKADKILEYLKGVPVNITRVGWNERQIADFNTPQLGNEILKSNETDWKREPEYFTALANTLNSARTPQPPEDDPTFFPAA